ncbi:MAG: hypothetical protein E7045_04405 [Lentisphaerae bacterium]|nr:hypothetical protein [Lentisphaerota bacterium]
MKKIDVLNLANPFWGNAGTASPAAEGMARNWNWLKAQTGNTHPGALLPCGWVSAVPYSGAYSTGYGITGVSSTGPAPVAFDRKYAWGVTHFHTSGVGYLGYFYNYFLLTAAIESADVSKRSRLDNENAHPGYYSGTMSDYGVDFELTSGKYAAFHRYRFTADAAKIRLNVRQLGLEKQLLGNRKYEVMEDWSLEQDGSGAYSGSVTGNGVKIFYAVKFSGNIISETVEDGVAEIKLSGNNAQAVLAFSLGSVEEAKARLSEALEAGFDQTEREAKAQWTKRLSAIRVEFSKESDARIFYSALYHSLLKPVDAGCEYTDFQTMWDVYRTQLPLLFATAPDLGKQIVESMINTIERFGFFPNGYMMTNDYHHDDMQATSLVIYTLCDGFNRGFITDYARLKNAFAAEFNHADISDKSPTHRLDMAGALRAASDVAMRCGDKEYAAKLSRESDVWKTAYDAKTGLLIADAAYYEGTYWNYSFRPHTRMSERVALAGGVEKFNVLLDKFFGADRPCETEPGDRVSIPNRFEGMNNESDMETPYCYLWAGRSDRLAEVSDLVRRCRFCEGEGGCPGNNDSGGLSSWYVWSVLGIYPLTGTSYYLLASPSVDYAEIDLPNGTLKIEVERESATAIYPAGYEFNGEEFSEPWLSLDRLERGGTLKFHLSNKPAGKSPIPEWL